MVDWLVHHPAHPCLVCRVHGYAVSDLYAHLRDQHSDVKSKARNAIVAEYAGLEYGQPSHADFCYGRGNPIPAIDCLTVHDGFACGAYIFLTTSWKWFRVYWNKDHKRSIADGKQWSTVRLQTFFTGPKSAVHYFCVAASEDETVEASALTGRPNGQLVEEITEQWAYKVTPPQSILMASTRK